MKKIILSVYTDTLFIALVSFLFSFALFRFYLNSFLLSLLFALLSSAAISTLAYLLIRHKSVKKFLKISDEKEILKLNFHLATDTNENNFNRIYSALSKKFENAKKLKSHIVLNDEDYYFKFKLEPICADEVATLIKKSGKRKKVLLVCSINNEGAKLAANFGIRIMPIEEIYILLKETDTLPDSYAFFEKQATWKEKLKLRFSKKMYKGYFLSGAALLIFSLFTFFPVYYLISGGILLCVAVAVRFFGK